MLIFEGLKLHVDTLRSCKHRSWLDVSLCYSLPGGHVSTIPFVCIIIYFWIHSHVKEILCKLHPIFQNIKLLFLIVNKIKSSYLYIKVI